MAPKDWWVDETIWSKCLLVDIKLNNKRRRRNKKVFEKKQITNYCFLSACSTEGRCSMDGDERTTAIRERRSSYRYVLPSTVHARLTIDARCVHILLDPLATRVHSPSFVVQIGNPPKNPPTVTLSLSMSLYLARSLKREKKKVPWRIEPFSFLLSGLIFHACPFHPCCFYMLLSMENLVHTHTHTCTNLPLCVP